MAVSSSPFHTLAAQALKGNVKWQGGSRSVTDGATTASSTTVTSATANFTAADVGAGISGGSIPGGATISSVTNATTVVVSAAATSTATAVTLTITPVNDTFKMALFTTAPTLTDPLFVNLSGEITGTGYAAGGVALSSLTAVETEANSWGTAAAVSTPYNAGDIVRPATGNGYLYLCVVAGTSGATAPTWPTVVGETVADGTVTWECVGTGITVFSSGNASWASSTITADYAVVYDSTSGVNVASVNFGGAQSDSSGTFTVSPPSTGWFWIAGN